MQPKTDNGCITLGPIKFRVGSENSRVEHGGVSPMEHRNSAGVKALVSAAALVVSGEPGFTPAR